MPEGLHDLLTRTAERAASSLTARAQRDGLASFNERDHLQKAWDEALTTVAADWNLAPDAINGHRQLALPEDFDSKGGVDSTLAFEGELPIFLELKAGAGRSSLDACAWDALKLTAALRRGKCSYAFLIAATTTARWEDPFTAGTELFRAATHHATELRDRYVSGWRRWDADGYRPKLATPEFSTAPVLPAARFASAAETDSEWEIRIAQLWVTTTDVDDWLTWTTP